MHYTYCKFIINRLEDRLRSNTGFALRGHLAVFTRSAIIPPKVNRFELNLQHSEYIVGGWPWQILGAIRAVVTVWEAGKIFCQVNNARFHRFPVSQISRNLNTTTSISVVMKRIVTEFRIFHRVGSFFQKGRNVSPNLRSCDFRPP